MIVELREQISSVNIFQGPGEGVMAFNNYKSVVNSEALCSEVQRIMKKD